MILSKKMYSLVITSSLLLITACSSNADEPSARLERIDEGKLIYRYIAGAGEETALSLSGKLSLKKPYLVVFVATDAGNYDKAVEHGKKLAAWFKRQDEVISDVPVVIWDNPNGVGYTFHMSGWRYSHEEHASKGVMTPKGSVAVLDDALLSYRAFLELRKRGDERVIN